MDSLKKIKVSYNVTHISEYTNYTFEQIVADLKDEHGDKITDIKLLEENIYNGIKISPMKDKELIKEICKKVSYEDYDDMNFFFKNQEYSITNIEDNDIIDYDDYDEYGGLIWQADLTIQRLDDKKMFKTKIQYRHNDNVYDCYLVYGMLIDD